MTGYQLLQQPLLCIIMNFAFKSIKLNKYTLKGSNSAIFVSPAKQKRDMPVKQKQDICIAFPV